MYDISGRIKAFEFAFLPIGCKVMKKTKIGHTNIIDDTQKFGGKVKRRGYFKSYQRPKEGDSILLKSGQKELSKSNKKNTKYLGKF